MPQFESFVFTNDEMRDHQYQQGAARDFYRWIERKRIKFTFVGWTEGESARAENNKLVQGDLSFLFPLKFSVRIQKRRGGGVYIPLSEDATRWLTIKLK
jgi:hypothetical protein